MKISEVIDIACSKRVIEKTEKRMKIEGDNSNNNNNHNNNLIKDK